MSDQLLRLDAAVRTVPDFPSPGIMFKDITPLIGDPELLRIACELLAAPFADAGITKVAGIESRGFIFGSLVAQALGAGFVLVRKPGKLPAKTVRQSYDLEYGTDTIEMHADAIVAGDRVLIHDDVIATGGTASAAGDLLKAVGADVAGFSFLVELAVLGGRHRLGSRTVHSVLTY